MSPADRRARGDHQLTAAVVSLRSAVTRSCRWTRARGAKREVRLSIFVEDGAVVDWRVFGPHDGPDVDTGDTLKADD